MSTITNHDLDLVKTYVKAALDFPAGMEKSPRIEGYETALKGVLDLINTLELIRAPLKTG
jgi:hypothetical protein